MDALLINIATNGSGQSPLASSESGLEGGETAFAEALSSAMASSMQTAVMPDQQGPEKPVEGNGAQLLAALKGVGTPGVQPDLAANADRPTGSEKPIDGAEPKLENQQAPPRSPSGPVAPSDRMSAPTNQVPSVEGVGRDGTDDPVRTIDGAGEGRRPGAESETARMAGQPALERSSAEWAKQFQSIGGPVQPPSLARSLTPLENTAEVEPSAVLSRPQVSAGLDQSSETEAQAVTRSSITAPGVTLMASTDGAMIAEPTDQSRVVDDASQQTTRISYESNSTRASQQVAANPSHSPTIDPAPSATYETTEAAQARPQPTASSEASTLDVSRQRDLAQLLAVRPDGLVSAPRPSPSHRPAKPLADGAMPQAITDGVSAQPHEARQQSDPSPGQRAQPGLTTSSAAGQKPTTSVLPAVGANPTAQVSPTEDANLADTNRFQTLLAVDGAPIDGDRFEPVSAIGSTRSSSTPPPPVPGVQIGLQIARSLANGVERLTVHLHPAELGSVDIQLNFEDSGRLTAQIVAERPETLELLQRDSRLLERSLGDSGLKLMNDGLSFSLKQDQQQQQAGQQFQQQADTRQTAFEAGRAYDDAPTTEDHPLARRMDGLRLLDIET